MHKHVFVYHETNIAHNYTYRHIQHTIQLYIYSMLYTHLKVRQYISNYQPCGIRHTGPVECAVSKGVVY